MITFLKNLFFRSNLVNLIAEQHFYIVELQRETVKLAEDNYKAYSALYCCQHALAQARGCSIADIKKEETNAA